MKKQPIPQTDTKKSSPKLTPKERLEKDMDDFAHSKEEEESAETGDEDPDDIVHRINKLRSGTLNNDDSLEDPDDLVHGHPEEDDE